MVLRYDHAYREAIEILALAQLVGIGSRYLDGSQPVGASPKSAADALDWVGSTRKAPAEKCKIPKTSAWQFSNAVASSK